MKATTTSGFSVPSAKRDGGMSSGKASAARAKKNTDCNFPNLKKGAN